MPMDNPPSDNLFVGDLPLGITDDQIAQIFGQYGQVVRTKKVPEKGGKDAAMMQMATVEDATTVKSMLDGQIPLGLQGPVVVRFANPPKGKGKGKGCDAQMQAGYGPHTSQQIASLAEAVQTIAGSLGVSMPPAVPAQGSGAPAAFAQQGSWEPSAAQPFAQQPAPAPLAPFEHTPQVIAPPAVPIGTSNSWQTHSAGAAASSSPGSREGPASDNLFVGDLPPGITEEAVQQIFAQYGNVVQCKMFQMRDDKSAAMVRYSSMDEATGVKKMLDGMIPQGLSEPVQVRFANPKGKSKGKGKDGYPDLAAAQPSPWQAAPPATTWQANAAGWQSSSPPAAPAWQSSPPQQGQSSRHEPYGKGGQGDAKGMHNGADWGDPMAYGKADAKGYGKSEAKGYADPKGYAKGDYGKGEYAKGDYAKGDYGKGSYGKAAYGKADYGMSDYGKGDYGKGDYGKGGKSGSDMNVICKGVEASGVLPGGNGFVNEQGTLFVSGLPWDATEVHLFRLFSSFGAIAPKGARAVCHPEDGSCKGFGFVNYMAPDAAQAAISALHGMQMPDGRLLKVMIKRDPNAAGGGAAAAAPDVMTAPAPPAVGDAGAWNGSAF